HGVARPTFYDHAVELPRYAIENHKMKTRCFDHIDLRVTNMETAGKCYGKILPHVGFVHESPGDDYYTYYAGGGERPLEFFCLSEDKNHRPNGTRIAFWADTREEVDQFSKLVRDAGGKNLEGPEVCEDYSPGYYAFFFEDPDGNKLEICCREKPVFSACPVEAAVSAIRTDSSRGELAATIAILQTTR